MVKIGEDLSAMVEQIHLQNILQITAKTAEPVTKSKLWSRSMRRRSSTPKYCGKALESDAWSQQWHHNANCAGLKVERKEIYQCLKENRQTIINDDSDIFSSCKCRARFPNFGCNLHRDTEDAYNAENKSVLQDIPKQHAQGFSLRTMNPPLCRAVNPTNQH